MFGVRILQLVGLQILSIIIIIICPVANLYAASKLRLLDKLMDHIFCYMTYQKCYNCYLNENNSKIIFL